MITVLSAHALRNALALRDLTDPSYGKHAIQRLVEEIERGLSARWRIGVLRERDHPVVSVRDNYDRLRVPPDAVARDARYTRYLNEDTVLRTHTSAIVPGVLDRLATDPPADVLLSCPGICYRRDSIDRQHVGEPHQLDLWRIHTIEPPLGSDDLTEMIGAVIDIALGPRRWRTVPTGHPYTEGGVQIDVLDQDQWLEVGECGVAHPDILRASTLVVPPASGLAMGLGLDRLVMLRKGLDDIRLLRSTDLRIAEQMLDLELYRAVSSMPPVKRDLSIAAANAVTEEVLGHRVRAALEDDATSVESVHVVGFSQLLPGSAWGSRRTRRRCWSASCFVTWTER